MATHTATISQVAMPKKIKDVDDSISLKNLCWNYTHQNYHCNVLLEFTKSVLINSKNQVLKSKRQSKQALVQDSL